MAEAVLHQACTDLTNPAFAQDAMDFIFTDRVQDWADAAGIDAETLRFFVKGYISHRLKEVQDE